MLTSLASALEAEAQLLRNHAVDVMQTGRPVEVPWPHADGGNKPLHQLTSMHLLADAEALEVDAAKLRILYE